MALRQLHTAETMFIDNGITDGSTFPPSADAVHDAIEASSYTLPVATADKLGGIKVGSGLSIDDGGALSVTFPKATNVADSTAETVETLVTNFNGLLTALKTAGLMEADPTE